VEDRSQGPIKKIFTQADFGLGISEEFVGVIFRIPQEAFLGFTANPEIHSIKGDSPGFFIVAVELIKANFRFQEVMDEILEKEILPFFKPLISHGRSL
jgi:hypothetical protein